MSTKRKKPSGSEFRKSAKLIKEKKELSISTTRKLDSFFLLNEHKTAHGSETSTTDSPASPVDSSQSLEVAPVEITQDVNTPNYECRNELASSTSGVFTTDPADWDINNQTIDFVAMNGFSQNSDGDFSASKRTFGGVTRYLNKSLFFRSYKNFGIIRRNVTNAPSYIIGLKMMAQVFRMYGKFCAGHPWEVIVTVLTVTMCMFTVEQRHPSPEPKHSLRDCSSCIQEVEYYAADMIVMTVIRCLAVLYSYYQFCHLSKLRSKYILGITSFFTVISSFIFTSAVSNFLTINLSELKDAIFFFLLLIDLSKASTLAQFALGGTNEEIVQNIANGISILGPAITLDTLVETLVIGIGTLSGIHRLEMLSYIACLSVTINYIIFMTFYPASLSLILELSRNANFYTPQNAQEYASFVTPKEQKSNPLIQRVKIIMIIGLMLVYVNSRCSFWKKEDNVTNDFYNEYMNINQTHAFLSHSYVLKFIILSSDHIVILIVLLALISKFILFENKKNINVDNYKDCVAAKEKEDKKEKKEMPLERKIPTFFLEYQDQDEEKHCEDKESQTEIAFELQTCVTKNKQPRRLNECLKIYRTHLGASSLSDQEVILLLKEKYIAPYQIEQAVDSPNRGVRIRRKFFESLDTFSIVLNDLPYEHFDYGKVMNACCENVIGYVPIPVGLVGPLFLDKRLIHVPMATTEGCLVASTNRGCRALNEHGVTSRIVGDGMTRGPVVRFPSISEASDAMKWIEDPQNFETIKNSFDSTSRYARLSKIQVRIAARYLFIRFVAKTGDAMGMNMISKATEISLKMIQIHFPNMEIISISGNFCADKKPTAINWIEGRGKSVVCEAIVSSSIVTTVLKTTVSALIDCNIAKNMIGSSVAGSIGGFNAHAANIVTAIFIATGQDPAQNVTSSNCITIMEPWGNNGEDLYISCSMPSIEIGTIGGGTVLSAQSACLDILGVKGANITQPGENARQLARIVCATVLAGELSLMSALTAGHMVKSHLKYNRSSTAICSDLADNLNVPLH
ncbi:hypothetical protein RN001_015855 [Aquatica leii]|uniref:3-hydroxy-3-methylglutaryl coenzyme A reductase n=1 Tax=Aquatica leii TaxID=1421715 RepID=A0AAN7P101_9COLE|nr:hypothetical protein RN001_015855 [Aquatica leii]